MAEAPPRMESDIDTLLRLMNQLEFEGRQYAASLEKENQMIAELESSTASAKETVRLNEEAIKQMKEEEKLMDARYQQNMESCNSLHEACNILNEKEKNLGKELEDLRRKGKADRERRETMIRDYHAKYENYKKTYGNSKQALTVRQKEEEMQRLEKEYMEEKRKTQETNEKLERAKHASGKTTDGDVDFPVFRNLNDFIVRLAQVKLIYDSSVVELEYKTRRCEELKSSIEERKKAKTRREAEQKQQDEAVNRQKEFSKLGSQGNEEKTKDVGDAQIKGCERESEKIGQKDNTLQHQPSSTENRDQVVVLKSEVSTVPRFHARAPPQILIPMRQLSVATQQRTPMKSMDAVTRRPPTQHFKVPLVPVQFQLSTGKDSGKVVATDAPLLMDSLEKQDQMEEEIGPNAHQVDDMTVPVFQKKMSSQMDQGCNSHHQQSNMEGVPRAVLPDTVQQKNEADDAMMPMDTSDCCCILKTPVISYERPKEMDVASADDESVNELSETSQLKLPEASLQSCEVAAMHNTVLQKLSLGLDCESLGMSEVNRADDDLLVKAQFPVASTSPPPQNSKDLATVSSTSSADIRGTAPDGMTSVAPSIATDDCQSDAMDFASPTFSDCHFKTPDWVESPLSDDYEECVDELTASEMEPGPFAGDVIASPPLTFNFEEEMRKLRELSEAKSPDSYQFSARRMFSADDQTTAGEESSARAEKSKPVGDVGQPESGNNSAFLEFNLDTLFGLRAVEPTHGVCKALGKGGSDADIGAASRLEHGADDPPSGVGIFKAFQSDATASKADRGASSADDVFKMFGSKGDGDADSVNPQNSDFFRMFDIGGVRSDSVEKGGAADFFSDFGRKSSTGGSQAKGRFTLF